MKFLHLFTMGIVCLFIVTSHIKLFAVDNSITLSGFVYGKHGSTPVTGAHVTLMPENISAITNDEGFFLLEAFNITFNSYLRISHIRYELKLYPLKGEILTEDLAIYMDDAFRTLSPITIMAHHSINRPLDSFDTDLIPFKPMDSGDFLRSADNISGVRRGSFGIDPVMRGFQGSRLNIRVDGLASTAAACPNRMDPPTAHIRLSDIEKVEIHYGPHALQFGPSFGGTINFVKQNPDPFESLDAQGDVRIGFESNTGHMVTDARVYAGNRRAHIMVSGGFSETGNYADGDAESVQAGFRSIDYGLEGGITLSDEHKLKAGWSQSFVRDANFPALGMDMAIDDTYKLHAGYSWNPIGMKSLRSVDLNFYHSYVDHEMNNHNRESYSMRDAVALATTRTWGFRSQVKGLYSSGTWTLGASNDYQRIEGKRKVLFKMGPNTGNLTSYNLWQDSQISNIGFYGTTDYFTDRWTFSAGARLDINSADANDPAPRFENRNLSSNYVNASFSLGAKRELGNNSSFGLYTGRGVRSPDVTERFINFLAVGRNPFEFAGNPGLKPEANNQIDLVFNYNAQVILVQLTAFGSITQNFITATINPNLSPVGIGAPGVREFKNRGSALFRGFETSLTYLINREWSTGLKASFTHAQYTDDNSAVAEIPPFESQIWVRGTLLNIFQPELRIRQVSMQDRIDEAYGESTTDGFILADFHTFFDIASFIRMSLGVRNIFDTYYTEHLNRNFTTEFSEERNPLAEPGRRFFIDLNISF